MKFTGVIGGEFGKGSEGLARAMAGAPLPASTGTAAGEGEEKAKVVAGAFNLITFKANLAKKPYLFKGSDGKPNGSGWSRRLADALIQIGETKMFIKASVSVQQQQINWKDDGKPEVKVTLPTISIAQGARRENIFVTDDEETQRGTQAYLHNAVRQYMAFRAENVQPTTPAHTSSGMEVDLSALGMESISAPIA